MNKAVRISFKVIITLIVLYLIIAALLLIFIRPGKYKPLISEQIYNRTGMHLTIQGKISLKVFPWIGLTVQNMQLDNPAGFESITTAPYFIKIGVADINVAVFPLLMGKVVPEEISLRNSKLNLVTLANGKANWDTLTQAKGEPSTAEPNKAQKTSTKQNSLFKIPAITVTNTDLHWLDLRAHKDLELQKFYFQAVPDTANNLVKIATSLTFKSTAPLINLNLYMTSKVITDFAHETYGLKNFKLSGNVLAFNVPFESPVPFSFDAGILKFDEQTKKINIEDITASLANINLTASFNQKDQNGQPITLGYIKIPQFNPRELIQKLNLPYQAKNMRLLTQMAASADVKISKDSLDLTNIIFALDKASLKGNLNLINFNKPTVQFNFDLGDFDIDKYQLTPSPSNLARHRIDQTEAQHKPTPPSSAAILPLNIMSNWGWDGKITAISVVYREVKFSDIQLSTKNNATQFEISPWHAKLDDGSVDASVVINHAAIKPEINGFVAVEKAPAKILSTFSGNPGLLEGTLNFNTKLQANGNSMEEWQQTLNGSGDFEIVNGTIHGLDLTEAVESGTAFIQRKTPPQHSNSNSTAFSSLKGSFKIDGGVLRNPDLNLTSDTLNVNGRGNIDLRTQVFQRYDIDAFLKNNPSFIIPIELSGPIAKPNCKVNVAALTKNVVRGFLQKEIKKLPFNLDKALPQ